MLKQSQGCQDVSLLLLAGGPGQGTVIGYSRQTTACSQSLWRVGAHRTCDLEENLPALTVNALCDESSPAVGQSQPTQITELLQWRGLINTHGLVPLARSAVKDTTGYAKDGAGGFCSVFVNKG